MALPAKKEKDKKKRRGHGEGTVYYREDRQQWWAQVTIEGKRRTLTGKSEKEVVAKKKALEGEVAKGTYAEPSKVTLGMWLERWLEVFVKLLEDTTYENYESQVRVHIIPALGKRLIQQLRPSEIKSFLNNKQKGGRADGRPGGLSLRTVRLLRFILRAALKQAIKEGLWPAMWPRTWRFRSRARGRPFTLLPKSWNCLSWRREKAGTSRQS